jgi:hypothetical protein
VTISGSFLVYVHFELIIAGTGAERELGIPEALEATIFILPSPFFLLST